MNTPVSEKVYFKIGQWTIYICSFSNTLKLQLGFKLMKMAASLAAALSLVGKQLRQPLIKWSIDGFIMNQYILSLLISDVMACRATQRYIPCLITQLVTSYIYSNYNGVNQRSSGEYLRNTVDHIWEIQLTIFEKYSWPYMRNTVDHIWEIQLTIFEKYSWPYLRNTVCLLYTSDAADE